MKKLIVLTVATLAFAGVANAENKFDESGETFIQPQTKSPSVDYMCPADTEDTHYYQVIYPSGKTICVAQPIHFGDKNK